MAFSLLMNDSPPSIYPVDSSKSRKVSRDAASKAKKQLDEEIDKYVKGKI